MDFDSLLKNVRQESPVIQKDVDPAKYDAVAAKLCEKRRKIEIELEDTTLDATKREENALALISLKESMKVFGITEIDYQAYIHYQEKESTLTSPVTPKEELASVSQEGTSPQNTTRLTEPD